jgi:1-acyl-sn-glycerol-3-phosphate acyltransferase
LTGQRFIHYLFRIFLGYLKVLRLLHVECASLAPIRGKSGLILVANHPSLLDAVVVGSELPNIFCLMKSNLVHNVMLCGQSRLAGYVNNKSGAGLIKACKKRLQAGSNLLVFPEGTRTEGKLLPFKKGFALLACTTRTPVQTIVIEFNSSFFAKGWPFFRVPPLPLKCSLELGKRFVPTEGSDARQLSDDVEAYLRGELARRGRA